MEATQSSGADLQSAAKAIGNIMDGGNKKPQAEEQKRGAQPQREPEREEMPEESGKEVRKAQDSEPPEDAQTETEEKPETEYELPSSIEALAQSMGVDTQKLLTLKVKTKIDGQEGEVPLADIVKSYQLEGHINKKSMAFAEQQRAYENQMAQHQQMLNQQYQQLNNYTQYVESELFKEFQGVNWNELRELNPAEYAAKRQEFSDRHQAIRQYSQAVQQHTQQEAIKQQNEFKNWVSNIAQQESSKLTSKIPEWSNPEKASAEKTEIRGYLKTHGFDDEDLSSVIDHRYVLLARKAMLYDKLAQSKLEVTKKTQSLPTFIKQSSIKSKADVKAENHKHKVSQLKKSGSVKDAASLLYDYMT